jgi:hypothetical protein
MAERGESDEAFLARMEAEDAASFAAAVADWRSEKAAGRGEAKVMEAGGGFSGTENAPAEQPTAEAPPTDTAPEPPVSPVRGKLHPSQVTKVGDAAATTGASGDQIDSVLQVGRSPIALVF